MALSNLTDETKALMQKNNISPVAVGANQYMQSTTPRLNAINLYSRMRNSRPTQPVQPINTQSNNTNSFGQAISGLVNGGLSFMGGLNKTGVFNGSDNTGDSIISNAVTNYAAGDNRNSDSAITNTINSYVGSGSDTGDILSGAGDLYGLAKTWGNSGGATSGAGKALGGYGGLISGGINGLTSFAQSGNYKDGLQGIFSIDKDDSEIMQAVKGAVNGAALGGSSGNPWAALAGGVLGLGASFLDDI